MACALCTGDQCGQDARECDVRAGISRSGGQALGLSDGSCPCAAGALPSAGGACPHSGSILLSFTVRPCDSLFREMLRALTTK